MPEGLRAPAGVEKDATIAALLKKVRDQALELSVLSDELSMAKEHAKVCETRIAELLSTSAGSTRGSPTRSAMIHRSNIIASETALHNRNPNFSVAGSLLEKENCKLKLQVADLLSASEKAEAAAEEYSRKNNLMENHLRRRTDEAMRLKTQLEEAENSVQRLREEKDYLMRSSQPSNLRRLNKSAAAVATANAHLLQDDVRRLNVALKRAEHSQMLSAQREKGLQQALQKAEAQLAERAAADLAAANLAAKNAADATLARDLREVSNTPSIKATTYIRSTSPPETTSAAVDKCADMSAADRLGQSVFDADSLCTDPPALSDETSQLRAEVTRLRETNDRLLKISEAVHADSDKVDSVLKGGTFAWSELAQRLRKSEERVSQMSNYIKSLTGTDYNPMGNTVHGEDFDKIDSEMSGETNVSVLRASVIRMQTLLRQAEQERNILVDYLARTKDEKEALLAQKAQLEGQHTSLLQLQNRTSEENAMSQKELLDMGKFNNTLSSKCMHAEATVERLQARLVEAETELSKKTAEAESLNKETEELSQMQLQTLVALKNSREQCSRHEVELEKLQKAILESGINSGENSRSATPDVQSSGKNNFSISTVASTPPPVPVVRSDVNVQLLRIKLSEHERKYETAVKELATAQGHYSELRPRYQKLEARSEEQEARIRALVDELVTLRPLKEALQRVGEEINGRGAILPEVSAPPTITAPPASQVSAKAQFHGMRDMLLGASSTSGPASAHALSPPVAAVQQLPEIAWTDSSALHSLSPTLQASAAHLASFATSLHSENQTLNAALAVAKSQLVAETETATGLRAQVQALQVQVQSFGSQAMNTVQQFTTQLHTNEAENNARIRVLERENAQLLRCRDTLEHLKYVVASSGSSIGESGSGAIGLFLLKSHMPKLINLTPPASLEAPKGSYAHGSSFSSDSDSDNDSDSLEQSRSLDKGQRKLEKHRSKSRYLFINSPSRDERSNSQPVGSSQPRPKSAVPQPFPAVAPSAPMAASAHADPAPVRNDQNNLNEILVHFSDAMLSEVIGRALLSMDSSAPRQEMRRHVGDSDIIRYRLKKQLVQAQERNKKDSEVQVALTSENSRLLAQVTALQTEVASCAKEKARLESELEEVLSLSEKQQSLTSAQEQKLAVFKQDKALKVAQINSLQQRESAVKTRLASLLKDCSNVGQLVDGVMSMLAHGFGTSAGGPVDSTPSAYSYYSYTEPSHSQSPATVVVVDALDRTSDLVNAVVAAMSSLHRCLTTVHKNQLQTIQQMHQRQQQQMHPPLLRSRYAPTVPGGVTYSSDHNPIPRGQVGLAESSAFGISLIQNELSPALGKVDIPSGPAAPGAASSTDNVNFYGYHTSNNGLDSSAGGAYADREGLAAGRHLSQSGGTAESQKNAFSGANEVSKVGKVRAIPKQENHIHGPNVTGLMSPATTLQNRLKDAKSKFASLREAVDAS